MRVIVPGPKRLANLAKHGIDLADFELGFSWDRYLELPARPSRTGRVREMFIGAMNGRVVTRSSLRSGARLSPWSASAPPTRLKGKPMTRSPDWTEAANLPPQELDRLLAEDYDDVDDNPAATPEQFAGARPGRRRPGQRGPGKRPAMELMTVRVDADLLAAYRSLGAGWQAHVREVLRAGLSYAGNDNVHVEKTGDIDSA